MTIKEIIKKHTKQYTDILGVITITFDHPAIAKEICREIEEMFIKDERYTRAHEIHPIDWRSFKKANGVEEAQ